MKRIRLAAVATTLLLALSVPVAFATPTVQSRNAIVAVSAKSKADLYLKKHAAQYHWKPDLSDLSYVTTVKTKVASYVRYQQTIGGAEVFHRQVTVTVDKKGKVLLVVSDYAPYQAVEQTKTRLSPEHAEARAVQHISQTVTNKKWTSSPGKFGYLVQNGRAVPVYRVEVKSADLTNEWATYIHAGTGKLVSKKDLHIHATGTGKVFNPNPVETQKSAAGLSDNRDADSTALNNQLQTVTLQGLDGSGYLRGQYATISSKAKTYSGNLTFNYTRSNDSFEDVMAYYHIDTLQRYIQSLGFNNINNRSITVNVNGTNQDNSWYSPSTQQLTFGTGGVDDAEDAGIIAHEYGHAIQDNQVPGFGQSAEGGAMGEGFGDFLGATYEDALTGDTFGKACIGEWDATSYSTSNPPCLRRLDNNKVYPRDVVGEVHADGEIWSQGLYDMAQAFGRDVATKIILQSHWSLTPNATFHDGAKAIKTADQLLYGGAHAAQIDAIWAARGISTN